MNTSGPWATEDFPEMSWHDVHVHGLSLENFDSTQGSADLLLDIDYIMEWSREGADLMFRVCRAELRFERVFGLKLALDYASPSAGMSPFALSEIKREQVTYPTGYSSFKWRLEVNWPAGLVEFEAPAFKQRLIGAPRLQREQVLAAEHRELRIDA